MTVAWVRFSTSASGAVSYPLLSLSLLLLLLS